MAELKFDLEKGVRIGDSVHTECVLREATVGDLLRAARASEVVVLAPTGRGSEHGEIFEPAILINPYLMEINTLRHQIERIGDIKGPLDDVYWEFLSEADIALIKSHAELLGGAITAPGEVVQRGRTDAQRADGGNADSQARAAD